MDPAREEARRARVKRPTPRWVWWSALAILGLYGLFVLLLSRLGLLDFPSMGDGQAFAAVLGLLGGFFASSITFIGLLIKHSIDERNAQLAEEVESRRQTEFDRTQQLANEAERRLQLESDRNTQRAEEAEKRLKLDSSIRAVDLLSTPEGKPAAATEQAGALFALAHLGQLDLALTLLKEIWGKGHISTDAATVLIDQGLTHKSEQFQWLAASTLAAHAELLGDKTGDLTLPNCIDNDWPKSMSMFASSAVLDALLTVMASRPKSRWQPKLLLALLVTFDSMRRNDRDAHVQAAAISTIVVLLEALALGPGRSLFLPSGDFSVDELTTEIESLVPWANAKISEQDAARIKTLRERWISTEETPSPERAPGQG
jgi:hypothetical protein